MYRVGLEKAEKPEIKLPTFDGSQRKQENSRKQSASLTTKETKIKKPLMVWITTNLKILKEIGIPDHFTCLLKNLYSSEEQQLVPDMEQWTGSKLERSTTSLYIVTLLI